MRKVTCRPTVGPKGVAPPLSEAILHRGKSLIRKRLPLGPCSRTIPMLRRRSWGARGGGLHVWARDPCTVTLYRGT